MELSFRRVKQNPQIECFFGTSENAVKSQVSTGATVYALTAIIRKKLGTSRSLHDMLEILSVQPFQQMPLAAVFAILYAFPQTHPVRTKCHCSHPETRPVSGGRAVRTSL